MTKNFSDSSISGTPDALQSSSLIDPKQSEIKNTNALKLEHIDFHNQCGVVQPTRQTAPKN